MFDNEYYMTSTYILITMSPGETDFQKWSVNKING